MKNSARAQHADLVLEIASKNQRLMDALAQRPHLMNPYPNIITRLSKRSRKFRRQLDGEELPKRRAARPRPRAAICGSSPTANRYRADNPNPGLLGALAPVPLH